MTQPIANDARNGKVRFAGAGLLMLGAWWHRPWLFQLGLLTILAGWLRGAFVRQSAGHPYQPHNS